MSITNKIEIISQREKSPTTFKTKKYNLKWPDNILQQEVQSDPPNKNLLFTLM